MDAAKIRQAIEDALEADGFTSAKVRRDIGFHMTDWLSDLEEWTAYCQAPDSLNADQAIELLTRFLLHVPNHLAAASKLATGEPVTDIFGVGATSESD